MAANGEISQTFSQTNRVPQGSVLSATVCILAIKDICSDKYDLYEDLVMFLSWQE